MTQTQAATREPMHWRRALLDLFTSLVPLLTVAASTWWLLELPRAYFMAAMGLYTALVALVISTLPEHLPGPGLGHANRVTLGRATLIVPVATLAFLPVEPDVAAAWWIIGMSTVAMVLDGIDGRVSRGVGCATTFGARFDMELDAFLMLALSVLVWRSGQTGAWVVLIGMLRYFFLGPGWLRQPLNSELPSSQRRKAVCAVQGIALLVCLAPIIPPVMATIVASTALALLICSFGVDIRWLSQKADRGRTT